MKKIRILIADDHPIVRAGFKQVLSETPDMEVTDEAGNGQEVMACVRKKEHDIVLLDISMPGRSGLEVLKDLKDEKPKLPVLILSMYPGHPGTPGGCFGLPDEGQRPQRADFGHPEGRGGGKVHQRHPGGAPHRVSRHRHDPAAP